MPEAGRYKPEGRSDISVYVVASDAGRVVDFIRDVLNASELLVLARPDGTLMHAEYKIGDSVVMITQATADYPAFPVWLHVYVPDVNATYGKALAHGATSVQEPKRGDDDDRRGGVMDAAGNTWWISTFEG